MLRQVIVIRPCDSNVLREFANGDDDRPDIAKYRRWIANPSCSE